MIPTRTACTAASAMPQTAKEVQEESAVSEAWLLGALGEIDGAFEVLARAEEKQQCLLVYTGAPGFDPLRADQRFDALLQRLGLPSAASEHA